MNNKILKLGTIIFIQTNCTIDIGDVVTVFNENYLIDEIRNNEYACSQGKVICHIDVLNTQTKHSEINDIPMGKLSVESVERPVIVDVDEIRKPNISGISKQIILLEKYHDVNPGEIIPMDIENTNGVYSKTKFYPKGTFEHILVPAKQIPSYVIRKYLRSPESCKIAVEMDEFITDEQNTYYKPSLKSGKSIIHTLSPYIESLDFLRSLDFYGINKCNEESKQYLDNLDLPSIIKKISKTGFITHSDARDLFNKLISDYNNALYAGGVAYNNWSTNTWFDNNVLNKPEVVLNENKML